MVAEVLVAMIEGRGATFAFRSGTDWRLDLDGVPDMTKDEAPRLRMRRSPSAMRFAMCCSPGGTGPPFIRNDEMKSTFGEQDDYAMCDLLPPRRCAERRAKASARGGLQRQCRDRTIGKHELR